LDRKNAASRVNPESGRYRFLQAIYAAPAHFYAVLTTQGIGCVGRARRIRTMNLVIWLPALFALGLISMATCLAFTEACARI
jgi:hypothetical protein